MTQTHASRKKGLHTATVLSNVQAGECFWKMRLRFSGEAAQAFAKFQPGQFIQFDASELAIPPVENIPEALLDGARRNVLLRRPFSFSDVTVDGNATTADLLYCIVGPASLRMTTLREGDTASLVGPLGNGFSIPAGKRTALLVVGGMGLPPIRCQAKLLSTEHPNIETVAFIGARTVEALPLEERPAEFGEGLGLSVPTFAEIGVPSMVSTDDGSAGHRGPVTECLTQWLHKNVDNRTAHLNITVSWFVPKPHTPLGWFPQRTYDYFHQARGLIIDEKQRRRANYLRFKFHDIRRSLLESAIGRGDRRYGRVVETAWRNGARFDLWDECFDYQRWQTAFAAEGMELEVAAHRVFEPSQILPWEHLGGPDKPYLLTHYHDALRSL